MLLVLIPRDRLSRFTLGRGVLLFPLGGIPFGMAIGQYGSHTDREMDLSFSIKVGLNGKKSVSAALSQPR